MQHPTSNLVAGPGSSPMFVTDSTQQQNWTRPKNEATYMTVCGGPDPTWLKCFSLPHIDINLQNHPPRRDITLSLLYNPLPKILIIMLCIVVISWSFVHYGLLIIRVRHMTMYLPLPSAWKEPHTSIVGTKLMCVFTSFVPRHLSWRKWGESPIFLKGRGLGTRIMYSLYFLTSHLYRRTFKV